MTQQHDAPTATAPAPAEEREDDILELGKALFLAALIALTIRSLLLEPFNIPSGSMLPTLQIGDYLFVEKYSYGYSKYSFPLDIAPIENRIFGTHPERGDVAVFRQPKHPEIDYIKRIIGLPGDKIQVRGGLLYINGTPVKRAYKGRVKDVEGGGIFSNYTQYTETLPNGRTHTIYEMSDSERYDNTVVYTVPPGHYFAMGDNRDGSLDSRAQMDVGYVPERNLVGRAWFLFFSTAGIAEKCPAEDGAFGWLKTAGCAVMEYPRAVRWSRIFSRVRDL